MSKPGSNIGDMYCYRVAAYIKSFSNEVLNISSCSLKDLHVDALPPAILKESSFLNHEVLLDIIISAPFHDFFCECKHKESPKPLSLCSTEVKDSFLEFIGSEKYRINSFKRDATSYLLITNCAIDGLRKELIELQASDDVTVEGYCHKLEKRAPKKWEALDTAVSIKSEWFRNAAMRSRIIRVDDGTLAEAEKSECFKREHGKIMARVYEKNPELIPFENRIGNTVRFEIKGNEQITKYLRGFFIEISKGIVDQILLLSVPSKITKLGCDEASFVNDCQLLFSEAIRIEKAIELVIQVLNDIIRQSGKKSVVAITPGTYDIYVVNLDWFRSILSCNSRGFFEAAKIAKKVPTKLSKFLISILIQESMRPNSIVRKDVIDFSGFEEEELNK